MSGRSVADPSPIPLPVRWRWVSEQGLLGTVVATDLAAASRGALALHRRLREMLPAGTGELIPAAASVLVLFAGAEPEARSAAAAITAIDAVTPGGAGSRRGSREHTIEVAYGGEHGADLAAVARQCGLAESEVVARHAAALYTVAFVGFSPGFPYLTGLPPELHLARLASPRPRVPAGSVAIAGPFAGIYPQATPGGWRLLGRAELAAPLFDPAADPPARFAAGDRLRFHPI